MSFLILLLSAAAAYKGYKAKSALWFAVVGFLLAMSWMWQPYGGLLFNLINALTNNILITLISTGAGFGSFKFYLKAKGLEPAKKPSAPVEMQLLVGQVIDTKSSQTVFSDVHVSKDSFGNLGSYTTHDVHTSHSTWLRDLNNDVDVNYTGTGTLEARPGHIVGTMSWGGQTFLDINYSTKKVFRKPFTSTNPIGSAMWALAMTALGWILFPVFALLSPLVWSGKLKWNGGGGLWSNPLAPGAHKTEAIFTFGGGAAYFLIGLAMFTLMVGGAKNMETVGWLLLLMLGVNFALMQYVVKTKKAQEQALLAQGEAKLDERYAAGMARQAGRTAPLVAIDPEPEAARI